MPMNQVPSGTRQEANGECWIIGGELLGERPPALLPWVPHRTTQLPTFHNAILH